MTILSMVLFKKAARYLIRCHAAFFDAQGDIWKLAALQHAACAKGREEFSCSIRNCSEITCVDNADCADLDKLNAQVINGQFLSINEKRIFLSRSGAVPRSPLPNLHP